MTSQHFDDGWDNWGEDWVATEGNSNNNNNNRLQSSQVKLMPLLYIHIRLFFFLGQSIFCSSTTTFSNCSNLFTLCLFSTFGSRSTTAADSYFVSSSDSSSSTSSDTTTTAATSVWKSSKFLQSFSSFQR